jgi:hypothetical protein
MDKVIIHKETDGHNTYYSYSAKVGKHEYHNVGKFASEDAAMIGYNKMLETGRI